MFSSKGCGNNAVSDEDDTSEDDSVDISTAPCGADIDTAYLMTHPEVSADRIRPSAFAMAPCSLTYRNLSFSMDVKDSRGARTTKTVLAPVSGHFEPGELVALMGPSGSGKTTLLDMLALKKTARYDGEVWVNGRPRKQSLFRRIAAYVGQEDMMPPHWKVREAVMFNAVLKQSGARKHRKVDEWVDILLETFGLTIVEESMIGGEAVRGISGGQRRRVTLARGVAAHASLLFCDEPTSGLSATDAELCIAALRTICKRLCVTCLVVIHQPRAEVADMFDKFVLLTSNPGRCVYFGPMQTAQKYWQERGLSVPTNVNPTDYFLDTVTPGTRTDKSHILVEAYNKCQRPSLEARIDEALRHQGTTVKDMIRSVSPGTRDAKSEYATSFCGQFCLLYQRKLLLTFRNPMALGLPIAVPVFQGFVVGYMFAGTGHKNFMRQSMFAFCMLTMLCLAGTMGLIVLITERTLMKYEVSEKLYSEMAWALASQAVDVPLALTGAVLNVVIMCCFAELETGLCFSIFWWSLLLFFVYDSLFAFIGAVAADTRQAQVVASPCVSIFMLFNGLIITKEDAPDPLKWIFLISPNAYAMEGIMRAMSEENSFKDDLQAQMAFAALGFGESSAKRGIIVLGTFIALLRVGQLLGLKYLNQLKR